MARRFQLRGQSGPVANRIIELIEPEITLGRDLSNDLVISDSEVSRAHARLSWRDDAYVIEDLRSTNGTWVNGHPILRGYRLVAGDTVTLGKVSVFVYEPVPEPVTDTTPNPDASSLPEIIESTMMMPAWQKEISAAMMARRPEIRVQPDEFEPSAFVAGEEPPEPSAERSLSPGASFHREYLAALQAGDLEGLLRLYHPDATLLSMDAAVTGASGIAKFFEQYFRGAGSFTVVPTGKYIEGGDSILCETRVETAGVIAQVHEVFVLRDGRATHHFTCTTKSTSKRTKTAH
jgi:ketosteroid isomerase-like protein